MRYVVVLLLTVSLASAETFVVAAGVESYDDTNISPLKCAVADAKAFADAFRAAGAPEANVFVLTSDATGRPFPRVASRIGHVPSSGIVGAGLRCAAP